MARDIYITVIGDSKIDRTSLLQIIAEPVKGQSNTYVTKVRAGQILSHTTLIIDELPNIDQLFRRMLSAVVLVVSPQKGETEQEFISRVQQQYHFLKQKISNQSKRSIPVVVLVKTDFIAPHVAQRLQVHLNQMLVDDDAFFSFSAAQSSNKYVNAIFLKTAQLAVRLRSYYIPRITTLSEKVQGALAGLFIETLSDVIRKNPVHVLFAEIRKEYRNRVNIFKLLIAALLDLMVMPFYALWVCLQLTYLPFLNAYYGARTSAAEVIDRSIERINHRDAIAATMVSVLMIAAALCIVFPPAGLAMVLPSIVASVGLSGFSTVWLAIFASLAVFIVAASLYALGSNLYDYVTMPAPVEPQELSEEILLIPTNSAATQMTAAPPLPAAQPTYDANGAALPASASVFSKAAATPLDDKSGQPLDNARQPLLVPGGP